MSQLHLGKSVFLLEGFLIGFKLIQDFLCTINDILLTAVLTKQTILTHRHITLMAVY